MGVSYIGVRHHSPACARLVTETIKALRPAYVLIEGPSDVNGRIDEFFLGHRLPIAVFSSHRGVASFSPFCEYSPEWAALKEGRAAGAQTLFIDLPAWHPAFFERANRYADAELRYAEAVERLCDHFRATNSDALWDQLFEVADTDGLAERLTAYFDLLRGDLAASVGDEARERFMARWIHAAVERAGDRHVLVVTGGFHVPGIRALVERGGSSSYNYGDADAGNVGGNSSEADADVRDAGPEDSDEAGWPALPLPEPDVDPDDEDVQDGPAVRAPAPAASFLVPYSFKRLDAFTGYQSGMPSPGYYQQLWERGPRGAEAALTEAVATRLRKRGQPVSTADLIAARAQSEGLARLRENTAPTRADLLDGLVSCLVSEDLSEPLPWSRRGLLTAGTHPAVVEMVAALSGDRVGRLHPKTPAPPLVHDVIAELERLGLDTAQRVTLALPDPNDLERSRTLHRLRVLGIPGCVRESGPGGGLDPVDREEWAVDLVEARLAALIEAGAHGSTLEQAALAKLHGRTDDAAGAPDALSAVLFDAVLCGLADAADQLLGLIARELAAPMHARSGTDSAAAAHHPVAGPDPAGLSPASGSGPSSGAHSGTASGSGSAGLGPLGRVLAVVLGLWRHDRIYHVANGEGLARVIAAAADRVLWLALTASGPDAAAEPDRLRAVAALRDAVLYAESVAGIDRRSVDEAAARIAADDQAPPDLRGAALGLRWSLGAAVDVSRALPGGFAGGSRLGDWLAGLFVLAREQAAESGFLELLDGLVTSMDESEFLIALPALRLAFSFFPPREREAVARSLLERRGLGGSARGLLRMPVDAETYRRVRMTEIDVVARLRQAGVFSPAAAALLDGESKDPEPA